MNQKFEDPGHFCSSCFPSEDELILEARALLARRYQWRRLADHALRTLANLARRCQADARRSVQFALAEFDSADSHRTLMGRPVALVAA